MVADRADITAAIADRLISLKVTDEAGFKSDTLTFDLDDRDGIIALPRHGASLQVWLGYVETGLSPVGVFVVDEVTLSGFPQTLSVSAKAADMTGDIKESQTRSFDNITLGALVKTVAGEHGLTGKVDGALAGVLFTHLDQTAESNLHLITRLAKQHNGVAKVTNDTLIVAAAGQSRSMSGASLPTIAINKWDVSDYHASLTDREKYAAVTATYHDKSEAKTISVSTSDQKPALILRHTYDDKASAVRAAKDKLDSLEQGRNTLDVSLAMGNPALGAESALVLNGFRPGISGPTWTVTRVEHQFSNAGFKTTIAAEQN